MFKIKWGLFPAIAAFVLALATSLLLGHAGLFAALLRALLFAALFFALGTGAWILINSYIPELLFNDNGSSPASDPFSPGTSGNRVNITLGDTSGAALPGQDGDEHGLNDVEDIDDLVSGRFIPPPRHIDQKNTDSYNDAAGEFAPGPENNTTAGNDDFFMNFSSFIPGSSGEVEELESALDSFPSVSGDSGEGDDAPLPERKVSGNKPVKFEGDFNPKEIAAGIRTVLERDKG